VERRYLIVPGKFRIDFHPAFGRGIHFPSGIAGC
jgi:hypothetical protein